MMLYCGNCQNIAFTPLRSMTLSRWREHFPFLADQPELQGNYERLYHRFIDQAPTDCYEAILQPDYQTLEAVANSGQCEFCLRLVNPPGEWEWIKPRPSAPCKDLADHHDNHWTELRSASPVIWLQIKTGPHDPTPEGLLRALENGTVYVKPGGTLRELQFRISHAKDISETNELENLLGCVGASDNEHTGSDSNMALAKKWLATCHMEHKTLCSRRMVGETERPLRLLDLEDSGLGIDIRLCLTKSETDDERKEYATLSHRWGVHQPISTTTSNLDEHLKRISFASLSKTFQDAVVFTRNLGVRYLWIDSLCIMQDSSADKSYEIPRMVDIYNNALFNIAACAATDACNQPGSAPQMEGDMGMGNSLAGSGTEAAPTVLRAPGYQRDQLSVSVGLFSPRDGSKVRAYQLPLTFTLTNGQTVRVVATLSPSLDILPQQKAENSGLERRGWIFQERAFSKRVFSFEKQLLWFECGEMIASENIPDGEPRRDSYSWDVYLPPMGYRNLSDLGNHLFQASQTKGKDDKAYQQHVEQIYELWYSSVPSYSVREFTYETDRLLGISGLAARIHAATNDTYLAGLWKSELIRGLCWTAHPLHKNPKRFNSKPRAPTWSWASMKGPLTISYAKLVHWEPQIEILDAWTRPVEANNLFGDAPEGEIRIRGRLKLAQARCGYTLQGVDEEQFHATTLFDASEDLEKEPWRLRAGGFTHAYMDRIKDFTFGAFPVWVLPVIAYWPIVGEEKKGKKLACLVLMECGENTFSRQGFAWRLSKGNNDDWDEKDEDGENSWFGAGWEMRDVTLI